MRERSPKIDFDHHGPEYAANSYDLNGRLATTCPVAFSDAHGGYWIVSGYDAVAQAARDDATFSSRHDLPNGSTPFEGINMPGIISGSSFIEMDPPEMNLWRRAFNPWFSPRAVQRWIPRVKELASWCLDQRIETGSMEVIEDFAGAIPAIVTLQLLGLPLTRWREFSEASHHLVSFPPGTPEHLGAMASHLELFQSMPRLVAERRLAPRDDLLSFLGQLKIHDKPLNDEEIVETCILMIGGGVDTTSALVAHSLNYFNDNPEDRRRVIHDRSLIPLACEEFLRYFTPVQALGRTTTRDVELAGCQLIKHDRVLLSWAGANLDAHAWEDPEKIVIDRSPNRHAAFGLGVHRCIGSNLARMLFEVMVDEILSRVPDYTVTGPVDHYGSTGIINGIVALPVTFTPGQRVAAQISDLEGTVAQRPV